MISRSRRSVIKETSRAVADMASSDFDRLLDQIVEISLIRSRLDANSLVEKISDDVEAAEALSRGAAWISAVAPYDHDVASHQDLVEATEDESLASALSQKLRAVLQRRSETSVEHEVALSRINAIKGILPYFEDIAATVELRGMLDISANEHISNKYSRYVGVEPIASVSLRLDAGEDLTFQIGKSDLQTLINSLIALDARMDELSHFVRRGRE